MSVSRRFGFAIAAASLLAAMAMSPVGAAGPDVQTIASGLGNPRGIAVSPSGHVFVADAGGVEGGGVAFNSALLELFDRPGHAARIETIAGGLPSASSDEGEVTGAVNVDVGGDGTIALIIGGGPREVSPLFATLLRGAQGQGRVAADIQAFHDANPQPVCDPSADPEDLEIWCDHDDPPFPEDSNPYGVKVLNAHTTLVSDAGGNDLLLVDKRGTVSRVAKFPNQLISGEFLGIPFPLIAEPVPTSVDIGPDGYWYVSELKGFPFTPGTSRIWRIKPWAHDVTCDPSATSGDCTLFADGFTSITGIDFGPDGALYAVEMVQSSVIFLFIGTDFEGALMRLKDGVMTEIADGALTVPDDVAVAANGTIYVTNQSVFIGAGEVLAIRP